MEAKQEQIFNHPPRISFRLRFACLNYNIVINKESKYQMGNLTGDGGGISKVSFFSAVGQPAAKASSPLPLPMSTPFLLFVV